MFLKQLLAKPLAIIVKFVTQVILNKLTMEITIIRLVKTHVQ